MFKADYFTISGSIALGNANYFAKYKLREVNVPDVPTVTTHGNYALDDANLIIVPSG